MAIGKDSYGFVLKSHRYRNIFQTIVAQMETTHQIGRHACCYTMEELEHKLARHETEKALGRDGNLRGFSPDTGWVEIHEQADTFCFRSGASIQEDEPPAYYIGHGDYINMPLKIFFRDANGNTATTNYYATFFHELVHWTAAGQRLNRPRCHSHKRKDVIHEELVAEFGTAILSHHFNLTTKPTLSHAAYMRQYVRSVHHNMHILEKSWRDALAAVEYLLSLQP